MFRAARGGGDGVSVKILVSDPVHALITARQQVMRAELGRTVTMSEVIEDLFRRAQLMPAAPGQSVFRSLDERRDT